MHFHIRLPQSRVANTRPIPISKILDHIFRQLRDVTIAQAVVLFYSTTSGVRILHMYPDRILRLTLPPLRQKRTNTIPFDASVYTVTPAPTIRAFDVVSWLPCCVLSGSDSTQTHHRSVRRRFALSL